MLVSLVNSLFLLLAVTIASTMPETSRRAAWGSDHDNSLEYSSVVVFGDSFSDNGQS